MTTPILVDSNIIIYSINRSSQKNVPAKVFLENQKNFLVFAHQNILETLRIITHPKFPQRVSVKNAIESVKSVISGRVILPPNIESLPKALKYVQDMNYVGNRVFDAYLAATALSWGITTIATDNEKHFHKFDEIKVINPLK